MRLLLTGSNGFIGKYFYNNFAEKYNIQIFSFLQDDFNLLNLNGVEVVFHLSALVHQKSGVNEEEYERVNVAQTLELAIKAKKSAVKQFVFMSTIKVYGEETDIIYTETSECHPNDNYGMSKLKAEKALLKLANENFVVSIIRTPIVYGPGVKANMKNLISMVQKTPILPLGGIKNRRSMVHISNLCHLTDVVISQKANGIFLASDDEVYSTTKLIELIAKQLNKKVYLIQIPFFESILKLLKPSFHKRLYENLEVNNTLTKQQLTLENPIKSQDKSKMI